MSINYITAHSMIQFLISARNSAVYLLCTNYIHEREFKKRVGDKILPNTGDGVYIPYSDMIYVSVVCQFFNVLDFWVILVKDFDAVLESVWSALTVINPLLHYNLTLSTTSFITDISAMSAMFINRLSFYMLAACPFFHVGTPFSCTSLLEQVLNFFPNTLKSEFFYLHFVNAATGGGGGIRSTALCLTVFLCLFDSAVYSVYI